MARKDRNKAATQSADVDTSPETGTQERTRPNYAEDAKLTLRQAAEYLGVAAGRVRKFIKPTMEEDGVTVKVPARLSHEKQVIEGTDITVTRIPFSEIAKLDAEMTEAAKETGTRSNRRAPRAAGNRAAGKQYIVRIDGVEQYNAVKEALSALGIELESRYKNRADKKTRAQRKAEKAAAQAGNANPVSEPATDAEFTVSDNNEAAPTENWDELFDQE